MLYCGQLGRSQLAAALITEILISLEQAPQLLSNKGRQIQPGEDIILQLRIILQHVSISSNDSLHKPTATL